MTKTMTRTNEQQRESLVEFRNRLREKGIRRVEVLIREDDVERMRNIAKTLLKGGKESEELRKRLQLACPDQYKPTFEEWLNTPDD